MTSRRQPPPQPDPATPEAVRSRELAALWLAGLAAACGVAPVCYGLTVLSAPPAVRRNAVVDLLGPLAMCGAPTLAPLLALGAVAAGVGAWRESRARTGRPSVVGGVAVVLASTSLLGAVGVLLLMLVPGTYP